MEPPTSLIIDTTYRCNARCLYCRWGDGNSANRHDPAWQDLCLDPSLLQAAGINRVVFSGGEPMLHPNLDHVLAHYASVGIAERVIITNGLLTTPSKIAAYHRAGATGFAFSIDGADSETARATRNMGDAQIQRVLLHLAEAGTYARTNGLELTINCVLSSANCHLPTIRTLVDHTADCGASMIKFQPIFDDGYLGENAPHLRLDAKHAAAIRAIAQDSQSWRISTNPPTFFADLAASCEGRPLPGKACGLGGRSYVMQRGGLVVCPWIEKVPVGSPDALRIRLKQFETTKTACQTGPHCFCLQPREQRWGMP